MNPILMDPEKAKEIAELKSYLDNVLKQLEAIRHRPDGLSDLTSRLRSLGLTANEVAHYFGLPYRDKAILDILVPKP